MNITIVVSAESIAALLMSSGITTLEARARARTSRPPACKPSLRPVRLGSVPALPRVG